MKQFNMVRKFVSVAVVTVVTSPAFAAGEKVSFNPPDVDFSTILAWVTGVLAIGVIGICVAFKGIDLSKRGINKA